MGFFSKFFGSHEDEPKELAGFTSENDEALDELCNTLQQTRQAMSGICGGCGHPHDDHPQCCPTMPCCNEWYQK